MTHLRFVLVSVMAWWLCVATAHWAELLGREGNPAEHFARIFCASNGIGAFLGGDAVFQHGYHKLGVPFQTDDGKLSQRYHQATMLAG